MTKNERLFTSPLPRYAYWLFLIGILISILIGLLFYRQVSAMVQHQAEAELKRLSTSTSEQFGVYLQQMKFGLSQAATEQYVQTAIENRDTAALNQLLYGWQQNENHAELWAILDKDARIISTLRGSLDDNEPLSLNGLALRAIASANPIVSTEIIYKEELARVGRNVSYRLEDQHLLKQEGVLTQLVIVPVLGKNGQVLGALCGGLVLNDNQELLRSIFGNSQAMHAVYQDKQCIAYFTNGNKVSFPEQITPTMTKSRILDGQACLGQMQSDGDTYVTVSRYIFNAQNQVVGYQVLALPQSQYSQLPAWVANISLLTGFLLAIFSIIVIGNTSRIRQLFKRERQRSQESYYLGIFAQKLQECTDENEVYLLLKKYLSRDLDVIQMEFNIISSEDNCMESIRFTENDQVSRVYLNQSKCKPVLTGRINVYNDDRDLHCSQIDTDLIKSHVCIPFLAGGKVAGVVGLGSPQEQYWTPSRIEYLDAYLNLIGPTVTNIRLLKLLQAKAFEDQLTGLKNRHFLDQYLLEQLAIAERYETDLSLLMADIDRFKLVNDNFGHDAGDLVLKEVAAVIRAAVRGSDLVARYGGEEFVLVLPNTSTDEAVSLAERCRQAVNSLQVIHNDYNHIISVTISIGVASYPRDGNSLEALYKLADSALYLAKNQGRNQVRTAQEYLATLQRTGCDD